MASPAVTIPAKSPVAVSPARKAWMRFRRHQLAMIGLVMFGIILVLSVFAPVFDRYPPNQLALREGRWNKKGFAKANGLKGATLGVVGTGRIGAEVIRRALAFDMKVVAWSRSLTDEKAAALGVTRLETPIDVARQADVVTVHLALNDATRGIISREFLQAMKPGAMFINTAIEQGLTVRLFEVDHYIGWGTPNELRTYEYWQSCFNKWPTHPYTLHQDPRVDERSYAELEARYAACKPPHPVDRHAAGRTKGFRA